DVQEVAEGSLARVGESLVIGRDLVDQVANHARITKYKFVVDDLLGTDIHGTICAHPLRGHGYDFDVPLLPGEHVTADAGTGFVHTAPGHGEDDFELILKTFPTYTVDHPDAFNVV